MGINKNTTKITNGKVYFIPSGSNGIEGHQYNTPTTASYNITYVAYTSSILDSVYNLYSSTGHVGSFYYYLSGSDSGSPYPTRDNHIPVQIQDTYSTVQIISSSYEEMNSLLTSITSSLTISTTSSTDIEFIDTDPGMLWVLPTIESASVGSTITIISSGSGVHGMTQGIPAEPNISDSISILQIDSNDPTSFVITGSSSAKLYLSGSGKIGINTTNPTNDVDIKANSFKIRSNDGTKELEFTQEGKLITKEYGPNASGSEVLLTFDRGTFGEEEGIQA